MNKNVITGQAVYSKKVLSIYDIWVLGFSNNYLWKCPTNIIGKKFATLVSNNHLDVGVGTGYYLKKYLPSTVRRVALVDLNNNSLESTSKAIKHLNPEVYCRNILEPLALNCDKFDSVSINYLLHCLPGNLSEKSIAFSHLREVINEGGVLFGSTILGKNISRNTLAKKLMAFYNKKGIFNNINDDLVSLDIALKEHFSDVKIEIIGCVAIFSAIKT
ncbi:class I SAM-dependent methyltransferase [Moritella sp.]|uniref:class I SAM-dependent methyltransferase n=1 Tax=Moritella sp. TaxID=78556 RepID=UPI0025DC0878|nr:class I SAM-dependent methyltransferase [Moritella sp.]MCJ8348998.1 class I SAM-dependent methyltransferase [Moritella sp.]